MKLILAIAAGGAVGAVARYGVYVAAGRLVGHGFPWATLAVNVVGSFLLGALIEALALKGSLSPELRAFLVVGALGAFTTFSAFSLDAVSLFERGALWPAAAYVAASVILSIAALICGLRLARLMLA